MGSWSNFQEWKENGNCKTIKQFVPSSSSSASDTDHSFQNFVIKSLVCWRKMFHALLVQPSLMIGKQRSRSRSDPTRRKYLYLTAADIFWLKGFSAVCGWSQTWICQQNFILLKKIKYVDTRECYIKEFFLMVVQDIKTPLVWSLKAWNLC